jgi:hypothetical protein
MENIVSIKCFEVSKNVKMLLMLGKLISIQQFIKKEMLLIGVQMIILNYLKY